MISSNIKVYLNLIDKYGYESFTETDLPKLKYVLSVEKDKISKQFISKLIKYIEVRNTAPKHYIESLENILDNYRMTLKGKE